LKGAVSMSTTATTATSARGSGRDLSWSELVATLRLWRERARSRRELAGLDDHLLRDVGLSPTDANNEIDKPFWR
jgi:uncharacterized protein YjiS (DUF1127 family)